MKNSISLNGSWQLTYIANEQYLADGKSLNSISALKESGYPTISAEVPGNIENDLMRAGVIEDIYYSTNIWKCQKLENLHLFYSRTFVTSGKSSVFRFEGIDTIADIYLNGKLIGHTENMLIPHEIAAEGLVSGDNEIVVHITPAHIWARKFPIPMSSYAAPYNYDALYVRKAPHMYGWDIMPRLLSGGIWRSVELTECVSDSIDDVCMLIPSIDLERKTASFKLHYNVTVSHDDLSAYSLEVHGVCGESEFRAKTARLWHTGGDLSVWMSGCRFWWPKNYGDPNLYTCTFTLRYRDEVVATAEKRFGIRTIRLDRTSTTDENGSGEFCFYINGTRIFANGSNWVPIDAMHANDAKRLPKILPMLDDLNCNIVRCWGGNVYEDDIFYNFCDEHGIMVWQDFAMACAVNPQDDYFRNVLRDEVTKVVLRLRNHPCIVLWAGDNECDGAFGWSGGGRDPNRNVLTREVIPSVLWIHDFTRPYLPSSPYYDEKKIQTGKHASEEHLWGPRDYFKGEYYRNTVCHFASETGYHGCNSPVSLKRFIRPEQLWPWRDDPADNHARPDWNCHAACMEDYDTGTANSYSYRIPLMSKQVVTLFGSEPDNLDDFAKASQISQAEAKKYFIERFRVSKWRRTGIIWWNLIDGWPQISDAIVDYYGVKKLAYSYIKRSQQPLCMMFDEPADNRLPLHLVNDSRQTASVRYRVTDLTDGSVRVASEAVIRPDGNDIVYTMPITEGEKKFYLIEWTAVMEDGSAREGKNHYFTNILNISLKDYLADMEKAGFADAFEGFDAD